MADRQFIIVPQISTYPAPQARAFLGEISHIFKAIFSALQQRQSAYAAVLGALLELSGERAEAVRFVPDEALDATWEEPMAFDGCASRGQSKPGQAQPIHFVKTEKAAAHGRSVAQQGA